MAVKKFFIRSAFVFIAVLFSLLFVGRVTVVQAVNPSADLDQCANGGVGSTPTNCLLNGDWVNGNLGASKSHYLEGDSIPYRMKFGDLTLTSHTVVIEWDTTKSGKHASDYLTSFNRTETLANPCAGVSGCDSGIFDEFPVPVDPQVTGGGVTPVAGNFRLYGGTIASVSAYFYADGTGFSGDKSARIAITFTATQVNPVLAWGSHIATRSDWGMENSAISIPGSPYHMRLISLDGSGGNQDRSLSADAVIFPGSITIIKQANVEGPTLFPFSASPTPLVAFDLVDDGTNANTHVFGTITDFKPYVVTENNPSGWSLTGVTCSVSSENGGSSSINGATATINLEEGENWSCTYNNELDQGYLVINKVSLGGVGTFGFSVAGPSPSAPEVTTTAGSGSTGPITLNIGQYSTNEASQSGWILTHSECDSGSPSNFTITKGATVTCTFTNAKLAHIIITKDAVPNSAQDFTFHNNFGNGNPSTFQLDDDSNATLTKTLDFEVIPGADFSVSEVETPGWKQRSGVCTGQGNTPSSITVGPGETVTCTFTNHQFAELILVKNTVGGDGGFDFTMTGDTLPTSSHIDTASGTAQQSFSNLDADNTYTVSENTPEGWILTSSACTGTNSPTSITPNPGETVTCTFTNTKLPKLTVTKVVVNDNGGSKGVTDFPLFVDGDSVISGIQNTYEIGNYSISETSDPAYVGIISGNCDTNGNVSLSAGEEKNCTITNDDIAPQLTVIKQVINDDGGTASSSGFTMNVAGTNVTTPSFAGRETGVTTTLNAGFYAVSEDGMQGYAVSYSPDCAGAIDIGEHKTCTITNNDIRPQLTLIKHVINNNGGTLTVSDFPLFVGGSQVASGITNEFGSGTYVVSETNQSGYVPAGWVGDCDSSGEVSLQIGDRKTCEITNDDMPATLTIKKVADPKDLQDFNFTGTLGSFLLDDDTGVAEVGQNGDVDRPQALTFGDLNVGEYVVSESQTNQFWKLEDVSCVNTESGAPYTAGVDGSSATVSLSLGQDVTCTFTNHKSNPTRTLGFWQTHTAYTSEIYAHHGLTIGNGGTHKGPIDTVNKVFGAFYSSIPKKTNGSNRTNVDKSRMILLQQLVAAKLNCAAFGCDTAVQGLITTADAAYASGNIVAMNASTSALDAYNNSGDTIIIGNVGKATPKTSQFLANKIFWDAP